MKGKKSVYEPSVQSSLSWFFRSVPSSRSGGRSCKAQSTERRPPRDQKGSRLRALVDRAGALQPRLERNAAQTETDRRLEEENLTAIPAAGLLKIAIPHRFGGFESDMRTFWEVSRELGSPVTAPRPSQNQIPCNESGRMLEPPFVTLSSLEVNAQIYGNALLVSTEVVSALV